MLKTKIFNFKNDMDRINAYLFNSIVHNRSIGFARSALAFCTFISLAFNDIELLFPVDYISEQPLTWIQESSLFIILKDKLVLAKFIALFILIVVIVGWRPRYTGLFHWYIAYSYFVGCPVIDGGDQVATVLSLMLIFPTIMDNRKWHWQNNFVPLKNRYLNGISVSFIFMCKVQMAIIYFNSATAKFAVAEWVNGTAIYYWALNPVHGSADWVKSIVTPLFLNGTIGALITWGVLILEIVLAVVIFTSPQRKIFRLRILLLGIGLHLSIIFIHGLVSFFFAMIGGLIIYTIPLIQKENVEV